jgi:hypothetical protein
MNLHTVRPYIHHTSLRVNDVALELIEHFSVRADPSTGSGLKAFEGACPEAPRRIEALRRFFNSLLM